MTPKWIRPLASLRIRAARTAYGYILNCVLPCFEQPEPQTATALRNNNVKRVERTAITNFNHELQQRIT
jgi:hypothetical protein